MTCHRLRDTLTTSTFVPTATQRNRRGRWNRPYDNWKIAVAVDGKSVQTVPIDATTAPDRWSDVLFDLTPYAGRTVRLDLQCKGGAGYWRRIGVESR